MTTEKDKPSKSSAAYIQVHKDNVVGYFAVGAIFPPDYETRELARSQRNSDIQEKNPGFLLVADGFTDTKNEEQVVLKVVLTEEDKKNLKAVADGVGLFSHPVPVSRIAAIYVFSDAVIENLKAQEQTYEDAFLPFHLFSVFPVDLPDRSASIKEVKESAKDLATDAIAKFNAVLGLLAFMKNTNIYYPENKFQTYSDVFLKTIKLINEQLAELPSFGGEKVEERFKEVMQYFLSPDKAEKSKYLKSVLDEIYKGESFTSQKVKNEILGKNADEVLKKPIMLSLESKTDEAIKKRADIKHLDDKLAILLLIFLLKYKGKDNNDKYLIKKQLNDYVKNQDKAALILGVLGLYYGYRSLPKKEEKDIKLSTSFQQEIANKLFNQGRFPIKFKMDCLFDRVIIESVYQFSFFDKSGNFTNYLPEEVQNTEKCSYELPTGHKYNETTYFGKPVFTVERVPNETEQLILDVWAEVPNIKNESGVTQLKDLNKFLKERNTSSTDYFKKLKAIVNREIKNEKEKVEITLSEPTREVDNIPEVISIKAPKIPTNPEAEGTNTKPSSEPENREPKKGEAACNGSSKHDENSAQEQSSKEDTKTESSATEESVTVESGNNSSESKNKEPREEEKKENGTPDEKKPSDSTKDIEQAPEKEDIKITEQEEEISSTDDTKKEKESPKGTAPTDVASKEKPGSDATSETDEKTQDKTGTAKKTSQTTLEFDKPIKKNEKDNPDSKKTCIDESNEKK